MFEFFRASSLPQGVNDFVPEASFLGRCYCSAESRNQWIDWSGTTAMGGTYFGYSLSLENEKAFCESIRKQGSSFSIKELPLLVFDSGTMRLCFSFQGLYNANVAKDFIEGLGTTEGLIDSIRMAAESFPFSVAFGEKESFPNIVSWLPHESLFVRRSSPGKQGCSMVWTCNFLQMDRKQFEDRLNQYALNSQS